MEIGHKVSNASLYTDFNELSRLRADASKQFSSGQQVDEEAKETSKKVASHIEALFFQMVLKSMREAQSIGESAESDQTRFYQDMFDKQITLELSQNNSGNGTGLAAMIELQISGPKSVNTGNEVSVSENAVKNIELIRNQINRSLTSQKLLDSNKE